VLQLARNAAAARAAIDRPRVMKALGIGRVHRTVRPGGDAYWKALITWRKRFAED
jgi:hypothetical protein